MSCDPIERDGSAIGTICRPTRLRTFVDEPDGEPRWCFRCRKTREFRYKVIGEEGPSYYDPNPAVVCAVCNLVDGDFFPGSRYRVWWDE